MTVKFIQCPENPIIVPGVYDRRMSTTFNPEAYYERFGFYIPNMIFPTGNVVVDGLLYLYYGVCDTAIALATM